MNSDYIQLPAVWRKAAHLREAQLSDFIKPIIPLEDDNSWMPAGFRADIYTPKQDVLERLESFRRLIDEPPAAHAADQSSGNQHTVQNPDEGIDCQEPDPRAADAE